MSAIWYSPLASPTNSQDGSDIDDVPIQRDVCSDGCMLHFCLANLQDILMRFIHGT